MKEEKELIKITKCDDLCTVEMHVHGKEEIYTLAVNLICTCIRHPELLIAIQDILSTEDVDSLASIKDVEMPDFNEILKNLK